MSEPAAAPETTPFRPPAKDRRPYALTRGLADFDTMESNPEILRIQLRYAELEQSDMRNRRKSGVATDSDVHQANEQIELFKAKLDGDRLRFARVKLAAAEQRLAEASARYDAGIASGRDVEVAKQEVEIEKVRVQAAETQLKAVSPERPPVPAP